jgi:sulfate permease, SulP family
VELDARKGAGARSEMSPLVATLLALVTVLLLTPLFKNLPEAVLAALIIHAVSHLWKIAEFRRYRIEQPLEFWVGLATLLGVVTIDVLPGLVIGVVSMILLVVYHASRPHVSVLGRVSGVPDGVGDVGRHPDYERLPDLLVLRLEAPLFYANAAPVCEEIKRLVGAAERRPRAVLTQARTRTSTSPPPRSSTSSSRASTRRTSTSRWRRCANQCSTPPGGSKFSTRSARITCSPRSTKRSRD